MVVSEQEHGGRHRGPVVVWLIKGSGSYEFKIMRARSLNLQRSVRRRPEARGGVQEIPTFGLDGSRLGSDRAIRCLFVLRTLRAAPRSLSSPYRASRRRCWRVTDDRTLCGRGGLDRLGRTSHRGASPATRVERCSCV